MPYPGYIYSTCCKKWWPHPLYPGEQVCPFCGKPIWIEKVKLGTRLSWVDEGPLFGIKDDTEETDEPA